MKRVRALVHDQGSNMELSAAVLEGKFSCESLRCAAMGMPRWNSTYYMLKTLLANSWPVTAVLSDERVTKRRYSYLRSEGCYFFLSPALMFIQLSTEEDSGAIRSFEVKVAATIRRRWDLDSYSGLLRDESEVSVRTPAWKTEAS